LERTYFEYFLNAISMNNGFEYIIFGYRTEKTFQCTQHSQIVGNIVDISYIMIS